MYCRGSAHGLRVAIRRSSELGTRLDRLVVLKAILEIGAYCPCAHNSFLGDHVLHAAALADNIRKVPLSLFTNVSLIFCHRLTNLRGAAASVKSTMSRERASAYERPLIFYCHHTLSTAEFGTISAELGTNSYPAMLIDVAGGSSRTFPDIAYCLTAHSRLQSV